MTVCYRGWESAGTGVLEGLTVLQYTHKDGEGRTATYIHRHCAQSLQIEEVHGHLFVRLQVAHAIGSRHRKDLVRRGTGRVAGLGEGGGGDEGKGQHKGGGGIAEAAHGS